MQQAFTDNKSLITGGLLPNIMFLNNCRLLSADRSCNATCQSFIQLKAVDRFSPLYLDIVVEHVNWITLGSPIREHQQQHCWERDCRPKVFSTKSLKTLKEHLEHIWILKMQQCRQVCQNQQNLDDMWQIARQENSHHCLKCEDTIRCAKILEMHIQSYH